MTPSRRTPRAKFSRKGVMHRSLSGVFLSVTRSCQTAHSGISRVGSVKANIGHTEGCSFLASLVKVSLMLHHKEIIPNIRFNKANPKIDFPALKMQVQTEVCNLLVYRKYLLADKETSSIAGEHHCGHDCRRWCVGGVSLVIRCWRI